MHQRHTFSRQAGFTLIELMVVVAIVAILAVMAAPSYRDMIDRFRLRSAADDVLSMVSTARAQAVKNGLDTAISSKAVGTSWCVGAKSVSVPTGGSPAGTAAACDCASPSTCLVGHTTDVGGEQIAIPVGKHPGVTITSVVATDDFTIDGKLGTTLSGNSIAAPSTPINLRSPLGNYYIDVGVTALGQATLCTPSGKPTMPGVASC